MNQGSSSEVTELSRVIADIYDAAIDPLAWEKALQSATAFVGGSSAVLFWHDAATERSEVLHTFNDDKYYSKLYFEKYLPMNPVFPAALFMEPGLVHRPTDLVPQNELVETQFYKEWIAPQGIIDGIGVSLEKGPTRASFLNVRMDATCDIVGPDELRRMSLLVPHFQRAVSISRLFEQSNAAQRVMTETLDQIEAGVILVDVGGRIVFTNAPARAMIDDGKLLSETHQMLSATVSEADNMLKDIFAAAASGDAFIGERGIAVPLSTSARDRWFAHVLPLTSGIRARAGKTYSAIAAIFVRKTSSENPTPLEEIAKTHKLTASEVRVLDAVLKVSSIKAISELLGISQATVKTHLHNVFRKTGTGRQSDLVKLVAGI